ncbi:GIY-YIG nuclease family protein [Brumimicrobium oceani]|uniref:Excinuclease ABC subunit C n=1 Tax=Brumimicrobium oceani TaxID=2100725 RepID=A0A2U2XAH7_9FLAO|nr:GIY-YIG nuclease family protein [Brumimicrobium oceani]PWH84796.1 excinuclease ABC subunit C [Brumimicrobium oceani]
MRTTKTYFVYILTNKSNKTIYIGVTNNIVRRVFEHKNKLNKGFTEKYNINKLVYYETFQYIKEAIKREKQLNRFPRSKKEDLINEINPEWNELKPPINYL